MRALLKSLPDTLILPGLNGSGENHWQQHWARDHPSSVVVEQDNWIQPDLDVWRVRLEAAIAATNGVWLVAHSLGSLLAAQLATSAVAHKVRGALLVAPCDLKATERLHPGVVLPLAMPLRRLPFPSLIVASLNDPYMPIDTLRHISAHWGSGLVEIGAAGHINVASGFGRWAHGYEIFEHLKRMDAGQPRRSGSENASQEGCYTVWPY